MRALIAGGGELLWEVDGEPVAQAAARAVVAGMSRIGPVYTPPEHRGHGYAAAVTAAAARWALGAAPGRCCLRIQSSAYLFSVVRGRRRVEFAGRAPGFVDDAVRAVTGTTRREGGERPLTRLNTPRGSTRPGGRGSRV